MVLRTAGVMAPPGAGVATAFAAVGCREEEQALTAKRLRANAQRSLHDVSWMATNAPYGSGMLARSMPHSAISFTSSFRGSCQLHRRGNPESLCPIATDRKLDSGSCPLSWACPE